MKKRLGLQMTLDAQAKGFPIFEVYWFVRVLEDSKRMLMLHQQRRF